MVFMNINLYDLLSFENMLCDIETCKKRGINCFDSSESERRADNEFCTQLRHIKCKVARLARTQIQKKLTVPNYCAAEPVHPPFSARNSVPRGISYSSSEENVNARVHNVKGPRPIGGGGNAKNPCQIGDKRFIVEKDPGKKSGTEDDPNGKLNVAKGLGDKNQSAKNDPDKKCDVNNEPVKNFLEPEQSVIIPTHPRPVLGYTNVAPGAKLFSYWIKCILKCFTKKLKVLLIAVIIGILMWMALVYGAILGASLCSNGQFPSLQFGSSQMRISVF